MSELYNGLKKLIEDRHKTRVKECVDTDEGEDLLRAQGAARELEQLLSEAEQMENPQEPEKDGA